MREGHPEHTRDRHDSCKRRCEGFGQETGGMGARECTSHSHSNASDSAAWRGGTHDAGTTDT